MQISRDDRERILNNKPRNLGAFNTVNRGKLGTTDGIGFTSFRDNGWL